MVVQPLRCICDVSFKETFGYGLGCVFLVCDAPAILRVKIVVVVVLAVLVPGWVSQQDPGDFNVVLWYWYWYCGIGIVVLVLWNWYCGILSSSKSSPGKTKFTS